MLNRQSINIDKLCPAIICTADLSYYLVGAEDEDGKFYNIYSDDINEPLYAQSFEQAKSVLKTKLGRVERSVIVEMANPYDEMIGTETYGKSRMMIKLSGEE